MRAVITLSVDALPNSYAIRLDWSEGQLCGQMYFDRAAAERALYLLHEELGEGSGSCAALSLFWGVGATLFVPRTHLEDLVADLGAALLELRLVQEARAA